MFQNATNFLQTARIGTNTSIRIRVTKSTSVRGARGRIPIRQAVESMQRYAK